MVEILEQQGWSIWWDHKIQVGKTFDKVIEDELSKVKFLVVVWSVNSVNSDWVKTEAAEAKVKQILAPVLIDDVPLPLEFRRTETAILSDWKGGPTHPELQLLLSSVRNFVETAAMHSVDKPFEPSSNRHVDQGLEHRSKTRLIVGIVGFLVVISIVSFLLWSNFSPEPSQTDVIDGNVNELNAEPAEAANVEAAEN